MNKNQHLNMRYLIIIISAIIILVLMYVLFFKNNNKYTKLENEMIDKAKSYILNNGINTGDEIYLNISKIGVSVDEKCSITSGVFYHNGTYQAYLSCDDYESNINAENNKKNSISLKGKLVIILAKGINYIEPGYISNEEVNVVGEVREEEGVYNLYYETKTTHDLVIRKVAVIDDSEIKKLFPSISLIGEKEINLVQNTNYQELGVKASDLVDNDISEKVIIDSNLDITKIGKYEIRYTITNSKGFSNSIKRYINVINSDSDLMINYSLKPDVLTNKNVLIKLIITGEYQKIVYPNGKEGKELSFEVDKNGNYDFVFYDKYNRVIKKTIEIKNIDKEIPKGSCLATLYYNKTEIKVTNLNKSIVKYEYIIDGMKSIGSSNYTSNRIKPTTVKVRITDIAGNENELTCNKENKLTREIYTDSKGKNCLEGMVCYIQYDYGDARNYPFCSVNNNANACGGIGQNGCSITSASIVIANMGVKSKTGVVHTPYTVWNELYPINKKTGQCGGGCSGWSRIRDSIINAGLTAEREAKGLNSKTLSNVINNLKKGYPVIIYASQKPFSNGTAHYMTLLGIREDGYVFLSDSANTKGTKKNYYNNKQYYVDTWISPDDLLTGNVKEYLLVGPKGVFEGK